MWLSEGVYSSDMLFVKCFLHVLYFICSVFVSKKLRKIVCSNGIYQEVLYNGSYSLMCYVMFKDCIFFSSHFH